MKRILSLPFLTIIIIPLLLVLIWFKDGNIMGTGESGLPFYDPHIQYNINKDAWAYYTLGHPLNIGSAAIPTYWFLSKLQSMHTPGFIVQAIFIWLIFIISGFAIYKLVKELFPDIDRFHILLSVLFYWFNPFSLVNVWNRFLNNFFFFYALLPLSVYLLIKGYKTRKFLYAILIGFISAILSYALTSIAFDFLLWVILLYFSMFFFLINKKDRFFIIKFLILTIFFWILANFWWISQVFSYLQLGSFNAVSSTSFKTDTNFNTFSLISKRLGYLTYIFRLKHVEFFNNSDLDWVRIYLFPVIVLFEFLISGILLLPLIIKRKNIYVLMLGGLMLLSIFFAKGDSPPLGEIFDRAFLSSSFLQLFRNPFEKIGFILSFAASILFAVGCFEIEKLLGFRKIIYRTIVLFFLVVIWGFPFWTGYVFTANEVPTNKLDTGYQVKVPDSYKDVSHWLASQNSNFRLLVLPIGKEGITYKWDKGYSGVELSNQLFPKSSISFNTNIPFYDDISNNLERLFLTGENITKIMDILNSKYILVRKDIDWRLRNMRDPDTISARMERIASASGFRKAKEGENLIFWEYTNWQDKSLYLTNNLVKSVKSNSIEGLLSADTDKSAALYNSETTVDDDLELSEVINPSFKFGLTEESVNPSFILRYDIIFPAIRILPSSSLYPLVLIKEKLESTIIGDPNNKIIKKISLLGKRLVEAEEESRLSDFGGMFKALDNYSKQLKELYAYSLGDNPGGKDPYLVQEDLYKLFLRHSKVIEKLVEISPNNKKGGLRTLQKTISDFVINKGIEPLFGYLEQTDYPLKNRIIFQFTVEKNGNYELLFNIKDWSAYYKKSFEEPTLFQIDDDLILRKGFLKRDRISFGLFNLTSGKHEIGWNAFESKNLIDSPSEFTMEVDHGISEKSFPIKNFDPYATYVLNMNYLIKKGNGVLVSVEGNNDPFKKGLVQRQFRKNLSSDFYDFDLRKYTAYFTPSRTSDKAQMIFSVFPWNNCQDIYQSKGKERCEDESFRRPYDRTTQVLLSNISLVKITTETPFLKLDKQKLPERELPNISFNKLNNSEYQINIKNAKDKYALILSELYDPAWQIIAKEGTYIINNHFLANGYANGWIIDKKGDYQFQVRFIPQDLLKAGQKVSIMSLVLGFGLILFLKFAKTKK